MSYAFQNQPHTPITTPPLNSLTNPHPDPPISLQATYSTSHPPTHPPTGSSSGINRDSVDAQLSDLVDVIGFADPAKNRRPPKTALSRSLGNDGEVHNPGKIHKR